MNRVAAAQPANDITNSILHAAWVTDTAYAQATAMSIFSASQQTSAAAVFVVLMPPDDLPKNEWHDLRFLLPVVLQEVARCLYLDADVLVLDDLTHLWDEIDPAMPVSAARDYYLAADGAHLRALGLTQYFNSGVMGLNLQAWRTHGYTDTCLQLAASGNRRFIYLD